eukprot:scaffold6063_cov191-Skeletonema_marinoi.AAC.4
MKHVEKQEHALKSDTCGGLASFGFVGRGPERRLPLAFSISQMWLYLNSTHAAPQVHDNDKLCSTSCQPLEFAPCQLS